jgi:hypothetical protein
MSGIYFPPGTFADSYYSPHLSAMHEPPLSSVEFAEAEVYRFLWLRAFDCPMAVRVQKRDGEFLLCLKQLDGKGGYEPGKLVVNATRPITAIEWTNLTKYIGRASFWTLAELELERVSVVLQEVHIDGTMWMLEGMKNEQYHYVDRCSPTPDNVRGSHAKFYKCCIYLLELSGASAVAQHAL